MGLKTGLWVVQDDRLVRLQASDIDFEHRLEEFIVSDPKVLTGDDLLIIGRQERTDNNKVPDLLAIDQSGVIWIIELKRRRTEREAVAQILDYASWVASLDSERIAKIYTNYAKRIGSDSDDLRHAFKQCFKTELPEDAADMKPRLAIVAESADNATQRIVRYLNVVYGVPINVVCFHHFQERDGKEYFTQAWVVDEGTRDAAKDKVVSKHRDSSGRGTRPNITELVEAGLLAVDDRLVTNPGSRTYDAEARISRADNGYGIEYNGEIYDNPGRATRDVVPEGINTDSGWRFWFLKKTDGTIVRLDELRNKLIQTLGETDDEALQSDQSA